MRKINKYGLSEVVQSKQEKPHLDGRGQGHFFPLRSEGCRSSILFWLSWTWRCHEKMNVFIKCTAVFFLLGFLSAAWPQWSLPVAAVPSSTHLSPGRCTPSGWRGAGTSGLIKLKCGTLSVTPGLSS